MLHEASEYHLNVLIEGVGENISQACMESESWSHSAVHLLVIALLINQCSLIGPSFCHLSVIAGRALILEAAK